MSNGKRKYEFDNDEMDRRTNASLGWLNLQMKLRKINDSDTEEKERRVRKIKSYIEFLKKTCL